MPQTMPRRTGSRGARSAERAVQVPRLSASQPTASTTVATENAASAPRQPPNASDSGTASNDASAAPTLSPVV